MYDFVRLETKSLNLLYDLKNNKLIKDKFSNYNTVTNEVYGKVYFPFQGLHFELYPSGRIVIYGSIHKYYNKGAHNYNDFGFKELALALNDLVEKFGNEILEMKVTSLEFGLNIRTLLDPTFYTNRFIASNNKSRTQILKNDCKGYDKGIAFISTDKILKYYNKSKQFKHPIHLLRIENKYLRSRAIEGFGVEYLKDLLNFDCAEKLFEDLIKDFASIIIKEDINEIILSKNEQRIYLECINTMCWSEWDKFKRAKRKEQFKVLNSEHASTNYKAEVGNLLIDKYALLSKVDE